MTLRKIDRRAEPWTINYTADEWNPMIENMMIVGLFAGKLPVNKNDQAESDTAMDSE